LPEASLRSLSQVESRDATEISIRVGFYKVKVRFLSQHGFLVNLRDHSNAEIRRSTLIFTAVTQNHGDGRKSRHATKITVKFTVIVNTWLSFSA